MPYFFTIVIAYIYIFAYAYIFISITCWVHILLYVCFSELTIWHWAASCCALPWGWSPPPLPAVRLACSSLYKATGHSRERTPFLVVYSWILAWSGPCEDLPTGCIQLTSYYVSMFRKDSRNDLWGLLYGRVLTPWSLLCPNPPSKAPPLPPTTVLLKTKCVPGTAFARRPTPTQPHFLPRGLSIFAFRQLHCSLSGCELRLCLSLGGSLSAGSIAPCCHARLQPHFTTSHWGSGFSVWILVSDKHSLHSNLLTGTELEFF